MEESSPTGSETGKYVDKTLSLIVSFKGHTIRLKDTRKHELLKTRSSLKRCTQTLLDKNKDPTNIGLDKDLQHVW